MAKRKNSLQPFGDGSICLYDVGSYEREAIVGGLASVLKLAKTRVRDLPVLGQAARQALVAGTDQPEYGRRGAVDGAALTGTAVERHRNAVQLGCVPLFALAAAETKAPVTLGETLKAVRSMHDAIAARWVIVRDGGVILGELREFIARCETAMRAGNRTPNAKSARLNAVLLDSYHAEGIDRTDLPPSPEDMVAIFSAVAASDSEAMAIRREMGEWARYLAEGERPSTVALRALWHSLSPDERAAFERERVRLVDCCGSWTLFLADPRFDLEAARWAIEALPRRRAKKQWPRDLALGLLQLHQWFAGSPTPDARRPHGRPIGRGHKFVVDAFKLYRLPLTGIDSGQYMRPSGAHLFSS